MTVLNEIEEWSEKTPPAWTRDALRRIVTQRELAEADHIDLLHLCKKPHGLADGGIVPAPLSAEHIRDAGASGVVTLAALMDATDVNALESDQTLGFAAEGLTVV